MKKFIPYARQSIDSRDIKAVTDVLKSDYITQGPEVDRFEGKVAGYCGAKYAVAFNSGTSALHAACFAAGINKGDEAIVSPISFAASSNCVVYCGGKPKFADILGDTITIDPSEIQKAVTKRTKVVIPVDFAGHPAELEEIKKISSKYRLTVIEDAAHSLGAEYKNTKVGCGKYSDMTILSFHAVKHITTGEGGAVLTNSRKFYDCLTMFRTHGITRNRKILENKNKQKWFYEMQLLGFNYRITDIQCALGSRQMDKLGSFIKRRREIAEFYKENLNGMKNIDFVHERKYAKSSWHIFPIRIKKKRDYVFEQLRSKGIGVNVHYIPIYLHPYYRRLGYKKGLCIKAEKYYKETITLPLHAKMSYSDVNRVISTIKDVLATI